MPAAPVDLNREQRFVWVNPLYARREARPAHQIVGRSLAELVGERQAQDIQPFVARVLGGEQVTYERLADFPGLGRRWVSSIMKPAPVGWVAVIIDVHGRRQAEEELKRADARKDEFLAAL